MPLGQELLEGARAVGQQQGGPGSACANSMVFTGKGWNLILGIGERACGQTGLARDAEAGDQGGAGKFGRELAERVGNHSVGLAQDPATKSGLAFGECRSALSTRATQGNVLCISYSSRDGLSHFGTSERQFEASGKS